MKPTRFYEDIMIELNESCSRAYFTSGPLSGMRGKRYVPVVAISLSEDADKVRRVLLAHNILPQVLPEVQGAPADALTTIEDRLSIIEEEGQP